MIWYLIKWLATPPVAEELKLHDPWGPFQPKQFYDLVQPSYSKQGKLEWIVKGHIQIGFEISTTSLDNLF